MNNNNDDSGKKSGKLIDGSATTASDYTEIGKVPWGQTIPDNGWYQPVFPTSTAVSDFDFDQFTWPKKERAICTKCKKEEEVQTRYNWSSDKKLERIICKKCHTKAMDKLYGVDNNVDTEVILYEESKRNKDEKK